MRVPVILFGESFVDAVVEVLVVREDNMAADVVELLVQLDLVRLVAIRTEGAYKAFWGDVGRGQTTGRLVRVHDQP